MLRDRIEKELMKAVRILPPDCEALIRKAYEREENVYARKVLSHIIENIRIAGEGKLPLCQDCGMFYCYVTLAENCRIPLSILENEINLGCAGAAQKAFYRRSVVDDPVYDRNNTGTNLPVIINWERGRGDETEIAFLLKGFGSENCSSVRMIRPTDGEEGVVSAVLDMVRAAGGKPCPPMFLGVGIGGTMDKAAILSKKALIRKADEHNKDERYMRLEERLLSEVNGLGIGAGGLGGNNTCLSVAIETYPTHIAGLPVALSVNCWADRKAFISIMDEEVL